MQDPDLLKEALKKYKRENYHVQTWAEYKPELDRLIDKVTQYIKQNQLIIDAVVPILRGGNIPATFLAYTLDVLTILPVQYKYFFVPGKCELRRLLGISKNQIPQSKPVILLVEGNHCYGNQAKYAAKDLKKTFPQSKIVYAASNMDYNYQNVVEDAEVSFYGTLTNCCKELSDAECQKLGLEYKRDLIFPWENIDEEWEIIELKQHHYHNVASIQANSPLVASYPL